MTTGGAKARKAARKVAATLERKAADGGECILCGKHTHAVGVWEVQEVSALAPPTGKKRLIFYNYCGCQGHTSGAFELVEAVITAQAATRGLQRKASAGLGGEAE